MANLPWKFAKALKTSIHVTMLFTIVKLLRNYREERRNF